MDWRTTSYLDLDNTAAGLVIVDLGVGDISSGMGGIVEQWVIAEVLHGLDDGTEAELVTWIQQYNTIQRITNNSCSKITKNWK